MFRNALRNRRTLDGRFPTQTLIPSVVMFCTAATAIAGDGKDWIIVGEGNGQKVQSGAAYTLVNRNCGDALVYGERDYGINLKWANAKKAGKSIHVEAESGSVVKFGSKVAIKVDGGGYLKYEERRWGINLKWSPTPVYEWEIQGGTAGQPVTTGVAVSLYNTVEKDHMIYCKRPWKVINLGWEDDCIAGVRPPDLP
ncbi:MAG: hypothetical protein CHACPFDD_02740 [Phycisphaerae bacterium]|nr:hypothetical protein [Phycisphaerae bacterium]